ncbi:lactam utilization protein LamB [Halalkalibacillus sediminis]|uniref:5-oxoprolinase subunit A n=1 Tax=Halalkalibacillus sediminis TaxID=2018042 RepID=A0A2I0QVL5_9BACI|nr:5-oxoprolinase subunit PxpA [Halalkalibacillus sediminis]PKR78375.1 lactam utilization protein LamB [Halalkalibacillus sediminis]
MKIDLNADLGESFGAYTVGNDDELLKLITSANVACGFHAGDYSTIPSTIHSVKSNGVSLGAHPGFQDLQGFGRRMMKLAPEEIYHLIIYQLGAISGFAKAQNVPLVHVKPHGALYNFACKDWEAAQAIAQAVYDFDSSLILYGLCNSELVDAAQEKGLRVAREAFADRRYTDDGQLMSRNESGAVLTDTEDITKQVLQIVRDGKVVSGNGNEVYLSADTICIHGDTSEAVEHAVALQSTLKDNGITIKSL